MREIGVNVGDGHADEFFPGVAKVFASGVIDVENPRIPDHVIIGVLGMAQRELSQLRGFVSLFSVFEHDETFFSLPTLSYFQSSLIFFGLILNLRAAYCINTLQLDRKSSLAEENAPRTPF